MTEKNIYRYTFMVTNQELFRQNVADIDLTGLRRKTSHATGIGTIRITKPDGKVYDWTGNLYTGHELKKTHGFIVIYTNR